MLQHHLTGVIGSPKGNPLFLHLIQDFVQSKKPIQVQDYQQVLGY